VDTEAGEEQEQEQGQEQSGGVGSGAVAGLRSGDNELAIAGDRI